MKKGQIKVVAAKAPRGKNAAQAAKKAENERKAAHRLAVLQDKQNRARDLRRAHGYVGNDDDVIRKHEAKAQQLHVDNVLANPRYGRSIRRWLADRIYLPIANVERLIVDFLARSNNAEMAKDVAGWLDYCDGLRKAA